MHQERRWRKLLEEGAKTLKGGTSWRSGGAGRPHLAASGPLALRLSSKVFPCPDRDLSMADKFCVYFALEFLFSAFLEIEPSS